MSRRKQSRPGTTTELCSPVLSTLSALVLCHIRHCSYTQHGLAEGVWVLP